MRICIFISGLKGLKPLTTCTFSSLATIYFLEHISEELFCHENISMIFGDYFLHSRDTVYKEKLPFKKGKLKQHGMM